MTKFRSCMNTGPALQGMNVCHCMMTSSNGNIFRVTGHLKMSSGEWRPSWLSLSVLIKTHQTVFIQENTFHNVSAKYQPFCSGLIPVHQSPVNSPHKGQWRGALVFSLICAWINGWVNNREAGDLRRNHAHYDVNVMENQWSSWCQLCCYWRSSSQTLVPPVMTLLASWQLSIFSGGHRWKQIS